MRTIFWGGLIFSFFIAFHILAWKIRLPRRQIKTLLTILFGGLAGSLAALSAAPPNFTFCGVPGPRGPAELLHIALMVTALTLAYMITYTALEADSPSLVMSRRLLDAGARGVPQGEFETFLNDELLLLPRLRDLVKDEMAHVSEGRYRLTPKGELLAGIFIFQRRVLGLGKGG